jgi:AAA15 family ATPase/GTPase
MTKEHLTYFKVENFKRFDSLELADIGQFNLIVGDNNVGKTSVLEALLFDTDRRKCLSNLHKTLFLKGLNIRPKMVFGPKGEVVEVQYPEENFLRYIFKKLDAKLEFRAKIGLNSVNGEVVSHFGTSIDIDMQMADSPEGDYDDQMDNNYDPRLTFTGKSPDNRYLQFYVELFSDFPEIIEADGEHFGGQNHNFWRIIAGLYEHLLQSNTEDFPLISTSLPNNGSLPKAYFEQVDLSRKEKKQLIEDMRFLLPEIEDFEVRKVGGEDQLLVGMKGIDELMPISIFGESVTRATHILLEISKYRGKRLMIDEIDTGIHYSRMKNFLKTIFQIADKNEVQLFITTHSLECQQAFAEVFEAPDMVQHQAKARQFSLIENEKGDVIANKHNFEQLQYALEIGFETRGGKRGW